MSGYPDKIPTTARRRLSAVVKNRFQGRNISLIVIVVVVATVGYYLLSTSQAATPVVIVEPEKGMTLSPAAAVNDNTASGSGAIRFAPSDSSTAHDYVQDFNTPVAAWPGNGNAAPGYGPSGVNKYGFCAYPDGQNGTNNAPSVYWPSKVVSVHDGYLDMWNHQSMASAILPFCYNGFTYGTWSVTMRVTANGGDSGGGYPGYHNAFLLWPDDGSGRSWPAAGEFDYPEADTNVTNPYMAIVQPTGSFLPVNRTVTPKPWTDGAWHVCTQQWGPGFIRTYQDGVLVGTVTSGIPSWPMHPVLQNEFYTTPSASISGHTQVTRVTYNKSYTLSPAQMN